MDYQKAIHEARNQCIHRTMKKRTSKILVRVTEETHNHIQDTMAKLKIFSMSELVRRAIDDYLKKHLK